MNALSLDRWQTANQSQLQAALALVREALSNYIAKLEGTPPEPDRRRSQPQDLTAAAELPAPSALETLCTTFNLSHFERDLLLLSAGLELDANFVSLCAAAQGDSRRTYATFGLALAALPEAHWSAILPESPLRFWRLIEVNTGDSLVRSPLRIDERILHYLTGNFYLDHRLRGTIEPVEVAANLPPSQQKIVERIVNFWQQDYSWKQSGIQLCGEDGGKLAIAAAACAQVGITLQVLQGAEIPAALAEREALLRLWEREAILTDSILLLECEGLDSGEMNRAVRLLERLHSFLIVTSREPLRIRRRSLLRLDVKKPSLREQQQLWRGALGSLAGQGDGQIEHLAMQFNLSPQGIEAACQEFKLQEATDWQLLWDACRAQARSRLEDLAQRLEPAATWEDLVLPPLQVQSLKQIGAHVRQRVKVYENWGFANKGSRGLGISALFAGLSGTGKTMAAEVLAQELRLDLYRIDLSSVVSKYIGETEKNLRRVFDAAETGGAILLFDEADALFGKRSEVKDSHDRYANIEVSYLLQRMEEYRGLAILTTNLKSALDTAFLRRLRFIVQFPFPDAAQRVEIWRRIFPANTPAQGLDWVKLGRLNVAGGNIRNIALNAAFLAADAGERVQMKHLLAAARSEYNKLEKSLTDAEVRDWV